MATTPLQALPVPSLSDPPNGPAQLLALGSAVEKLTVMQFADDAARSATIPTPDRGMVSFLADTGAMEIYYGVVTGWGKPWNMPWGLVAGFEAASGLVASITVSWTGFVGRYYEVTAAVPVSGTNDASLNMLINAAAETTSWIFVSGAPAIKGTAHFSTFFTAGGTGTHTITFTHSGGGGTTDLGTAHAYIIVNDAGASGNAPAS